MHATSPHQCYQDAQGRRGIEFWPLGQDSFQYGDRLKLQGEIRETGSHGKGKKRKQVRAEDLDRILTEFAP